MNYLRQIKGEESRSLSFVSLRLPRERSHIFCSWKVHNTKKGEVKGREGRRIRGWKGKGRMGGREGEGL